MTESRVPTRRPRDRRQQILAAASEQFHASGYHNVGITEIADSVGITGAALYRHFRGKEDLLLATIEDAFDHFAAVWAQEYADLDALLAAIADVSLQRRQVSVLWEREVGHLPAKLQRELRVRFRAAVVPVRAAIGRARPDLPEEDVDLLLWAVLSMSASIGYHATKLEPRRFQTRFVEAAHAVCAVTLEAGVDGVQPVATPGRGGGQLLPASRREAIIVAATRLFSSRSYQSIGVNDIGALAGITGASVYHHFPSKSAILTTALTRCLDAMFFDLSAVLETAQNHGAALDMLLRYFARTSIEHGNLGALLNEVNSLPAEEREQLRQMQADYMAEWAGLLQGHRPSLTEAEARVLVHATRSVVHSLLNIPHVRRRPGFDREIVTLGRAVLGLLPHPRRQHRR